MVGVTDAPYINEDDYLVQPEQFSANREGTPPPPNGAFLFPEHQRELQASAIDPAVIAERKYQSISRPTTGDKQSRDRLRALGLPGWAIDEDRYYPGLLVPMYGPTGQAVSFQWKPRVPVPDKDGKLRKYASPRGQTNRLDVHPRNCNRIIDPTVPLWITEGIKKADSLTSRGLCVVAMTGVFNWRSNLGALGDWEDVPMRGRDVTVCFDADALTNPNVIRAMQRLGKWLKSKGAKTVQYLVVPPRVNGTETKGADDYFAAGGTLEQLTKAASTVAPTVVDTDDEFTDARLAEILAANVLDGRFCWCSGLGWLAWDGRRWAECSDATVGEPVRQWALEQFAEAAARLKEATTPKAQKQASADMGGWYGLLSLGKQRAVLNLSRGIVERKAGDFDPDPDLINTPTGVVDLRTGLIGPHNPDLLMTKITSGSYRPGYTHPDWDKALEALDKPEREWFQTRIGQGITGHRSPDGVNVILQGAGENGKSLLSTDGVVPAMGDYATLASHKLLVDTNEHSEELATLRGKRLLIAEEMTEDRALNIAAIKRISDVGTITARHVHQRNMTFKATHTLFATTNYVPIVNETDHGTWRRLKLLTFPYTYRKAHEPLHRDTDRRGDARLKARVEANRTGQHDAIVTWCVEGARRWYRDPGALAPTEAVEASTTAWRATADRILGFWGERLTADRKACIWTTDLLSTFNSWLKENGHNMWAKETFGPRFTQHSETTRHGVEYRKVKNPKHISRWTSSGSWYGLEPVPERAWVWKGVRFRTPSDLGEDEGVSEVSDLSANSSTYGQSEKVSNTSDTSDTKIDNEADLGLDLGLCTVCLKPLGETYVALGRTTHPGCRVRSGGER